MSATKGASVMSKKRLQEIRQLLEGNEISNIDDIMKGICEIMKFNPDYAKNKYTPERNQKHQEWRYKKAEELGVSVSMIANGKYKKRLEENKST